jgi:hypothetical protein
VRKWETRRHRTTNVQEVRGRPGHIFRTDVWKTQGLSIIKSITRTIIRKEEPLKTEDHSMTTGRRKTALRGVDTPMISNGTDMTKSAGHPLETRGDAPHPAAHSLPKVIDARCLYMF